MEKSSFFKETLEISNTVNNKNDEISVLKQMIWEAAKAGKYCIEVPHLDKGNLVYKKLKDEGFKIVDVYTPCNLPYTRNNYKRSILKSASLIVWIDQCMSAT